MFSFIRTAAPRGCERLQYELYKNNKIRLVPIFSFSETIANLPIANLRALRHVHAPQLEVPAPHFRTCPIPYALRVLLQANAADTMLQASATANRGARRLSRVLEVSNRVATRCSKYAAVPRRLQPWRPVGALSAADARRSSAGRRDRGDCLRRRHRHLTCARDGGAARDRRVCVATCREDGV